MLGSVSSMVGVDSNDAYTFLAYHAGNDALPGDEWQMAWVLDEYFYPGCQADSQVNTTGQVCHLCRDPASALLQWLLAPRFVTDNCPSSASNQDACCSSQSPSIEVLGLGCKISASQCSIE